MASLKMEKLSQKALERKSNKPIMEKKRRARINYCLNQLKALILETNNERSRHSKLEKADILEMTVLHLQKLRAYHILSGYPMQAAAAAAAAAGANQTSAIHQHHQHAHQAPAAAATASSTGSLSVSSSASFSSPSSSISGGLSPQVSPVSSYDGSVASPTLQPTNLSLTQHQHHARQNQHHAHQHQHHLNLKHSAAAAASSNHLSQLSLNLASLQQSRAANHQLHHLQTHPLQLIHPAATSPSSTWRPW